MKKRIIIAIITGVCGMLTACDSYDCSLKNTVACQLGFYNSEGQAISVTDTMTITAYGTDSVLYNRGVKTSSVALPMSYYKDKDTLQVDIYDSIHDVTDWITIEKTNTEHFESLDCPVKMFHTITGVSCSHNIIDSVVISSPTVEYNNGENIKIYLHTAD